MAESKQPPSPHEESLDNLLDRVCNVREELIGVERALERLRSDIRKIRIREMAYRKGRREN
jgi:hypothetical protein